MNLWTDRSVLSLLTTGIFLSAKQKERRKNMGITNGEESAEALFETRVTKGRTVHKLFSLSVLTGMILIWLYRLIHIPRTGEDGRYAWIGMLLSEAMFGLYWILCQSCRWRVVVRTPFKDKLSKSYEEKLPGVDIFVCTADPLLEPPLIVINTVLSLMSYNYPSHKLTVYLSDDGCSELTFYALLEASKFSRYWIPFCNKNNVEPRSPEVYLARNTDTSESATIEKLYVDMKNRIDSAVEKGYVPKEMKDMHKGFSEWDSKVMKQDHHSIVKILIDGRNPNAVDAQGNRLPTLVYLSREKKPGRPHNFKAGSMNALIRVSSEISNAPIILNLDCDMYSNDPDSLRDALCFFFDEKLGKSVSYVQFPQRFDNITKNDIYSNVGYPSHQIELSGFDGFCGAPYSGTGCFHRRESLSGMYCNDPHRIKLNDTMDNSNSRTIEELEEASKALANYSYEEGTSWGKEIGVRYGCLAEDILTGLTIKCRGWKSVYYNPRKNAFQGVAPITLETCLVQYKRWSEGLFQIFMSKYCPFIYGRGKMEFGLQMGYCTYLLWAPISLPALCYVIIPALCLLHDLPLFPKVSSLWFAPFAYVFIIYTIYSLCEELVSGNTLKGWWNSQRIWIFRRTTSFFFAFTDTISSVFGLSQTSFVVTTKVADEDEQRRYEQEILDFGGSSIMFVIIAALALINLFSLGWGITKAISTAGTLDRFAVQLTICGALSLVNLPVYEALFLRGDKGRIQSSVMFKSIVVASVACLLPLFLSHNLGNLLAIH